MIKFSDKRNWNVSKFDNHNLYYYGNLDIVEKIIQELIKKNKIDRLFYEKIINNEYFSFFDLFLIIKTRYIRALIIVGLNQFFIVMIKNFKSLMTLIL